MNIFVLDEDPAAAAIMLCDKHIPKMIVESAQMLSTAHRMLDGTLTKKRSRSGKTMVKYYKYDDVRESLYYAAVHHHHPCTIWTMESSANYTGISTILLQWQKNISTGVENSMLPGKNSV